MKFTTVTALVALTGSFAKANVGKIPESDFGTCFKITPTESTINQDNLPKLVCFDSSIPEEKIFSELESYLEANNVNKQDVILATWTEIKD